MSLPITIGVTNVHWAKFCFAYAAWLRANSLIGPETYNDAKKQLDNLSNPSPEPSFTNFKQRAIKVLPEMVVKEIVEIPEEFALHTANLMVVKDNNDVAFEKYSGYRENLKNIGSGNLELFQILNGEVTTVGYQFALFYNSFRVILENLILFRKYVEFINKDVVLASYFKSYAPDKLDFIAQKVELSKVTSFASLNLNWFVSAMKNVGIFVKAVIGYVKLMADKRLLEVDTSLFNKAISSADALLAEKVTLFEVDFSLYSKLFISMDSALSDMDKVVTTMDLNLEAFEKESVTVDKRKYYPLVIQLATRIFTSK